MNKAPAIPPAGLFVPRSGSDGLELAAMAQRQRAQATWDAFLAARSAQQPTPSRPNRRARRAAARLRGKE